jgi:hypothetical protein
LRTVLEYWSKSIADFGMRISEFEINAFFELYSFQSEIRDLQSEM